MKGTREKETGKEQGEERRLESVEQGGSKTRTETLDSLLNPGVQYARRAKDWYECSLYFILRSNTDV